MLTDKPVSSQFGAPMGRFTGPEFLTGKVSLRRVRLNSGGYDRGGAYWGLGQPLYEANDDCGNTIIFRATNRESAKAHLKADFDDLIFYR